MKVKVVFAALVMCLLFAAGAKAEGKASLVHFVVVSDGLKGVNYAQELPALEKELCRLAGGYTALGKTRGGSLHETGIVHQPGYTYVVAANRIVASEIDAFVTERFGEAPFILVWTAERFVQAD